MANSAGLTTRRLLCGGSRLPPVFRTSNGATLTREELANPEVFAAATQRIRGYDPTYTLDRTAHIRIERLMGIGRPLRIILDRMFPGW